MREQVTINGHLYWVQRDRAGNIVKQIGCDPPPEVPVDESRVEALAIAKKAPKEWTALDQSRALAFLLRRALR